jgi:hypothetical protein
MSEILQGEFLYRFGPKNLIGEALYAHTKHRI